MCSLEKNKENGIKLTTFKKKVLEKEYSSKLYGGFIGVTERMNNMQIKKTHLIQL